MLKPLTQHLGSSLFKPLSITRNMHVKYLPMSWKKGDNYAYLLIDDETNKSYLFDPAFPEDLVDYLKNENKSEVTAIVNTHHHWDHSGGNATLLKTMFRTVEVIAGKDSPLVSYTPSDGEIIQLGNIEITALHTPCHTQDSICYYAKDSKTGEQAVFTGDTLFTSGCGRFFEGTAPEMIKALSKLMKLPDETKVYPGHEYTASNVRFSKSVLGSSNNALNKLEKFTNENEFTTGAFTIKDEKEFNPFVRLNDPNVLAATGVSSPSEVMAKLRNMKNKF